MRSDSPRIQLFGELAVIAGDREIALPRSRKARALLAYLVITGRSHRRETLCSLLWDEADDPRGALRWTLSRIRRCLGDLDTLVVADRESIGLDVSGVSVDLFEVKKAIARIDDTSVDELERCVEAMSGEILEGLDFYEFDDYHAWCVAQRESVHRDRVALLRALTGRLQDDPRRALAWARQLVFAEPVDDDARVHLIELYASIGRMTFAERELEDARRVFRELGAPMSERLRRIGPQLRAKSATATSEPAPSPTPVPRSPLARTTIHGLRLVGRKSETADLAARLSDAKQRGRAQLLVVRGEPGVGKSRMLVELMTETRKRGGVILEGGAYEVEGTRPYGPWIDAIRRFDPALARDPNREIAPLFSPYAAEIQSSQEQLFEGIAQLLIERARAASLLLVALDDLQWFDEASTRLLHYAVRVARDAPIVFATTARSGELRDNANALRAVTSLHREAEVYEVDLGPLSEDEVRDLVRLVSNEWSAQEVFRESGGNALFALEVARSAPSKIEPSPSLRRVVRDRIERLEPISADVLRWAAILGPVFRVDILESLVSAEPDDLTRALEDLELRALIAGVVEITRPGGVYQFSHNIVHRVVGAELSVARKRLMHARVASWLEEHEAGDDASAAELAHHAVEAGNLETAAAAAVRAARHCIRVFARGQAVAIARRGLRYADRLSEPQRGDLSSQLESLIDQAEALPLYAGPG